VSPQSDADARKALEAMVTSLAKLESACRLVAAEIAGLRQAMARSHLGTPPPRRGAGVPPSLPVRR
jgi:hypothetical protein